MISPSTDSIIGATIILILSLTSLIISAPVLWAIYKIWKETDNAFYLLLIPLSCNDCFFFAMCAFYSAPCSYLGERIFGKQFDALFMGFFCNLIYFTDLALLINIALNRYWSICRVNSYKTAYQLRPMLISLIVCYAFGFVSSAPQLFPCCPLRYFAESFSFEYDAKEGDRSSISSYIWYDRVITASSFMTLFTIYGCIFGHIRRANRVQQASSSLQLAAAAKRRERLNQRLAVQSVLIVTSLFITGLAFTFVPIITDNKWASLCTLLINVFSLASQTVIYLLFNTQIRHKVQALLGWKNDETNQVTLTVTVTANTAMNNRD